MATATPTSTATAATTATTTATPTTAPATPKNEEAKKPQMLYRFLGRSGLKVSVFSFGNWITGKATPEMEEKAYQCFLKAYEAGVNFFDTAEVYAGGVGEEVLGRIIKKAGWKRSDLVISTKLFWGGNGPNDSGLSRKHIIEGLNASLKRLQLDYVDLLFCHRPDPTTPIEETVRAMNFVINQGKAFYWGTSEWSAQQIAEASGIAKQLGLIGPLMEQPQYNMLERNRVESEYQYLYPDLGLTTWSPLAYGLLSGKYNDAVPSDSRFADPNFNFQWKQKFNDEGERKVLLEKIHALQPIAASLDCSLAQLALAWCAKNPNVSTVIMGASRPSQIEENVKAIEVLAKLTDKHMEEIDAVLKNKPEPIRKFR